MIFKVEQWWEGPAILIEDLAVKENFKKQGIGKRLIDNVENYAKNIKAKVIYLTTHKKSSAVKFYTKQDTKLRRILLL